MSKWFSYEFQVKHFKYEDCSPERFYTSQVRMYQAVSKGYHRYENVQEIVNKTFFLTFQF